MHQADHNALSRERQVRGQLVALIERMDIEAKQLRRECNVYRGVAALSLLLAILAASVMVTHAWFGVWNDELFRLF